MAGVKDGGAGEGQGKDEGEREHTGEDEGESEAPAGEEGGGEGEHGEQHQPIHQHVLHLVPPGGTMAHTTSHKQQDTNHTSHAT